MTMNRLAKRLERIAEELVATERRNVHKRFASDVDAEKLLTRELPHGSGIDYDWTFEKDSEDSVRAENGWHYMNSNGYYLGGIPFTIILRADGSFGDPEFDIEELAKSDLGREIAFNFMADGLSAKEAEEQGLYDSNTGDPNFDAIDDEEIKDLLDDEFRDISDLIWESVTQSVTPAKLGNAVKAFLAEA